MKLNISTFTAACLLLVAGLSSCLKENYEDGKVQPTHNPDGPVKVVELGLTATSNENFFLLAVDNSNDDTVVNFIPVKLGFAAAPEDVHVTVSVDAALLDAYNTENGTGYEVPPADKYTFVNAEVTIPKGSNTAFLQVRFKPSDFLGHDYGYGLRITGIKEPGYVISGNFGTGVAAITIKNEYDGVYESVGHFTHPNPDLAGDYDQEWDMITSGVTSVTAQLKTTATFSVFIEYTIDPATNFVTVASDNVALDPINQAANYYDPATRTFHYDFTYSGGTRHAVGTAVYTGPR